MKLYDDFKVNLSVLSLILTFKGLFIDLEKKETNLQLHCNEPWICRLWSLILCGWTCTVRIRKLWKSYLDNSFSSVFFHDIKLFVVFLLSYAYIMSGNMQLTRVIFIRNLCWSNKNGVLWYEVMLMRFYLKKKTTYHCERLSLLLRRHNTVKP